MTQVARACSLGKLASCGCQPSLDVATNTWMWKGCNHNVDYGNDFARKFLDSKENAKDLQSQINLHNNRAGRLVRYDIFYLLSGFISNFRDFPQLLRLCVCYHRIVILLCEMYYLNMYICPPFFHVLRL